MNARAVPSRGSNVELETLDTANDRFKRSFGNWFWGSMIAATVIHFMMFQFWPEMTAEDFSYTADELEAIELPPEVEIPPPPEAIARPATPVITEAAIDTEITIAPTTFEDNPIEDLPPPPADETVDISAAPTFTPYTTAPDMTNRDEVGRALMREYPSLLRDAGIGGIVEVWFFINENGRVQDTQVNRSSGHAQLDQAALRVADIARFTPAMNRDQIVPVWVSIPITFEVR